MWLLVKSEILYWYHTYLVTFMIPVSFTIFIVLGHPNMNEDQNISKILWPFIVGLLPLLVIVKSWGISNIIEKHGRINNSLSFSIRQLSISRIISGLIPIIGLVIYLVIVHLILIQDWGSIVKRVFYLFGSNFVIVTAVLLTFDLQNVLRSKLTVTIWQTGTIVFLPVILIGILIDQLIFTQLANDSIAGEGLIFFCFGLMILVVDMYVFQKRNNFLV